MNRKRKPTTVELVNHRSASVAELVHDSANTLCNCKSYQPDLQCLACQVLDDFLGRLEKKYPGKYTAVNSA